jgi:hypothetical protein
MLNSQSLQDRLHISLPRQIIGVVELEKSKYIADMMIEAKIEDTG